LSEPDYNGIDREGGYDVKKALLTGIYLVIATVSMSGCWSQLELNDRGFVQAVAIDKKEDGGFRLSTLFYKPSGSEQGSKSSSAMPYFTVVTEGETIFEATRDITLALGRKAQWSHMRVLLIGEEVVGGKGMSKELDYFIRDHEVRGVVSVMITAGKAGPYLKIKPIIENTFAQQLKTIGEQGHRFTAKTMQVSLTELHIRSLEQVPLSMVPYVRLDPLDKKKAGVSGLVVVDMKSGMRKAVIPSEQSRYVLMLNNQFESGILKIPCDSDGKRRKGASVAKESFEVVRSHTKINPIVHGDRVTLHISISVEGTIGELKCSSPISESGEGQFIVKVEQLLLREASETMEMLQKERIDVIDAGGRLYRKQLKTWKRLSPEWESRFAASDYRIRVKVKMMNSGVGAAVPLS
jgi:germination protein, Ger(x)C family